MTTDGPWTETEKTVFETAIGIPSERTYWTPGGFANVPPSNEVAKRSRWVEAVAAINHRYLFLDPDTGFYDRHNGESEKKLLLPQLTSILNSREALIIYRHQYWPRLDDEGAGLCISLCVAWPKNVEKCRFLGVCLSVAGCKCFLYFTAGGGSYPYFEKAFKTR